ncbi:Nose resistant to fluoxetine protein 6 [Eufriesea mexicana]|uniref:Nose resistant to fluoxetine protein 6 n=1 Tax=Eufriesea mexicana TaxID=516756 RepID=A0A310SGQ6_9HYME|nr:PREDICTED: nose resistant to fluoxetine protein 6-like [Eufriesea mexicana]XP_017765023.1 PREDICTED: nose resistant to fluoxetine protein 6-like [Eufriesea mexicana]OAD61800.1 Nose resistant to fluoxetine protein 6 [Eufriesea mexicana]
MKYKKISSCHRPWLSLLLLTMCCAWIQATPEAWKTMKETLPAYAITDFIDHLNSTKCQRDMKMFRDAVDHKILWGLRTLDASGEPNSGFTSGNNFWTGNRFDCIHLSSNSTIQLLPKHEQNNSLYRNPNEEFPPFELNFFSAYLRHYSTTQYHVYIADESIIILGLCLPKSCTKDEVTVMVDKMLRNETLFIAKLYSMHLKVIEVSNLQNNYKWLHNPEIIICILILSLALGLVILGTLYDVIVYQKRLRKKTEFLTFENNNTTELKNDMEEKCENNHDEAALATIKPKNKFGKYLICFSCYSNLQHIFRIDSNSESIDMFHGMRFMGMAWIIIGHTFFYGTHNIGNKYAGSILSEKFYMQVLTNGTFSVDTYFFISGFLLSYVFLKIEQKQKSAMHLKAKVAQFFSLIVKRYVRLTPALLLTMVLAILNFAWYNKVSIFIAIEKPEAVCRKYWWRNLLYINNLFAWNEMCLSWTWYLANDMQYFIFGSFLLLLSLSHYKTAVGISITIIFGSILFTAYTTYELSYIPTLDGQYEVLGNIYQRPWYRIPPYLIGVATSQLLSKWNYKLHLSKKMLITCWSLGVICNCSILFGIVNKNISINTSMLYTSLSRTCWAFGISWLVIACCTNNGGIVNKILSYSGWIPLSKLTYCTYLLNPIIVLSFYSFNNYTIFIDVLSSIFMFLGTIIICYISAILLSLISEVPFITLQRLIISPRRRTK